MTPSERAKAWLDRWGLRWNSEGGTVHMPPGSGSALAEVDLVLQFEAAITEDRQAVAREIRSWIEATRDAGAGLGADGVRMAPTLAKGISIVLEDIAAAILARP